jgi:hypothetical protein
MEHTQVERRQSDRAPINERPLLAHPGKTAHRVRRPLMDPKRTLESCPSLPL